MFDDLRIYEDIKEDIEACNCADECDVCTCDTNDDDCVEEECFGLSFIKINDNFYYSTTLCHLLIPEDMYYLLSPIKHTHDVSKFNWRKTDCTIIPADEFDEDFLDNLHSILDRSNPIYAKTATKDFYLCCRKSNNNIYIYIVKDCAI